MEMEKGLNERWQNDFIFPDPMYPELKKKHWQSLGIAMIMCNKGTCDGEEIVINLTEKIDKGNKDVLY
jgi:hypothetical protein